MPPDDEGIPAAPSSAPALAIPAAPTETPFAPMVLPSVPFANSNSPIVVKGTDITPQYLQPPSPAPAPPAYGSVQQPMYVPPAAPKPMAAPAPAYAPAPMNHAPQVLSPPPAVTAVRSPSSVADGKTKDAMELCAFAMAALKVELKIFPT